MQKADNYVYTGEYPAGLDDQNRAALDPLTPAGVLRLLFVNSDGLGSLASNPSLPHGIFVSLWETLEKIDPDLLDCFLPNPLTTFNHVLNIASEACGVEYEDMKHFTRVVEIFDKIISLSYLDESRKTAIFLIRLLSSPLIDTDEFRERAELLKNYLSLPEIVRDSRFDTNSLDFSKIQLTVGLAVSIIKNPNSQVEVLHKMERFLRSVNGLTPVKAYENLNYPIELSAHYHFEKLDTYKWSPTYLLNLEAKVDRYLAKTTDDGPWADLPLAWKLKMLAE